MRELEDFKTMEDLLRYKKELEIMLEDGEILEEIVENVWYELLKVNNYINDIYNIKNTNGKWFAIILTILGLRSRDDHYIIKIINNSSRREKIYTLDDSLYRATIEDVEDGKEHSVVLFTNQKDKSIKYDEFDGKFDLDAYLESDASYSKVLDSIKNQLSEKEIKIIGKFILDSYKEENKKGKTKIRKCD